MKKILMITTGGTIASIPSDNGLIPEISGKDIISLMPELKNICTIDTLELLNIDSSNISKKHYILMLDTLEKNYDNGYVVSTSLEDLSTESEQESPLYVTYDTLETRYWDYYYYYSDMDFDEYGMYFSLKIGTDGSWFGYDKGDKDVRNLGYEFCEKVRDLDSAQALAYAATVTSTADIASSILDLLLKPTTSGAIKPSESDVISSVLNILGHFNAPANAAERWSKAYYAALDCNDVYSQFRDAL